MVAVSRLLIVAGLLAVTAGPAPGRSLADGPGWDFVVTVPDLQRGVADVEWTLRGMSGEVTLCADMDGAERYVQDMTVLQREGAGERRLPFEEECWQAQARTGRELRLHYRYHLGRLARDSGNPDFASRLDGEYIFNDGTALLRPEPIPQQAPITVEFRVPPGVQVVTPWERLPGPGWRYRYDSDQYSGGNYVIIGHVQTLGEWAVRDGRVALSVLSHPRQAPDDALRRWVDLAVRAVADFYGFLPGRRVQVVLAPVAGSSEPGVFGTVMRHLYPSVVLYFGALCNARDFSDDWVAVHELFHLGNPRVVRKLPWFIEGFTTYYQDVLRARSGQRSALQMWGDLHDGFRRHCDPVRGVSLGEESRRLWQTHHYTRVYWGGACVAFLADVAIRDRSGNKSSLDTVLRDLYRVSQHAPLDEDAVIAALERAAGQPLVRRLLESRTPPPLAAAYALLGIEPTGPDTVRLHDDARGAAIREAIFRPDRPD